MQTPLTAQEQVNLAVHALLTDKPDLTSTNTSNDAKKIASALGSVVAGEQDVTDVKAHRAFQELLRQSNETGILTWQLKKLRQKIFEKAQAVAQKKIEQKITGILSGLEENTGQHEMEQIAAIAKAMSNDPELITKLITELNQGKNNIAGRLGLPPTTDITAEHIEKLLEKMQTVREVLPGAIENIKDNEPAIQAVAKQLVAQVFQAVRYQTKEKVNDHAEDAVTLLLNNTFKHTTWLSHSKHFEDRLEKKTGPKVNLDKPLRRAARNSIFLISIQFLVDPNVTEKELQTSLDDGLTTILSNNSFRALAPREQASFLTIYLNTLDESLDIISKTQAYGVRALANVNSQSKQNQAMIQFAKDKITTCLTSLSTVIDSIEQRTQQYKKIADMLEKLSEIEPAQLPSSHLLRAMASKYMTLQMPEGGEQADVFTRLKETACKLVQKKSSAEISQFKAGLTYNSTAQLENYQAQKAMLKKTFYPDHLPDNLQKMYNDATKQLTNKAPQHSKNSSTP